MKFAICCDPTFLPPSVAGQPLSSLPRLMDILQEAGADYLEFSVGAVTLAGGDAEFDSLRTLLEPYPLKAEVFNCFLPKQHRVTGPEVDLQKVLSYCETALGRCKELGGEVVVLGSGGARSVPKGYSRARALGQFTEFCRELSPIAEAAGLDIAIEPLNRREDNLLLTMEAGIALVDNIKLPHIQLLADLYHMAQEGEDLGQVVAAGNRLRHAHVADTGRAAPGFGACGEADFEDFFNSLLLSGYGSLPEARCSFEGHIQDLEAQAGPALSFLKSKWADAALRFSPSGQCSQAASS